MGPEVESVCRAEDYETEESSKYVVTHAEELNKQLVSFPKLAETP